MMLTRPKKIFSSPKTERMRPQLPNTQPEKSTNFSETMMKQKNITKESKQQKVQKLLKAKKHTKEKRVTMMRKKKVTKMEKAKKRKKVPGMVTEAAEVSEGRSCEECAVVVS